MVFRHKDFALTNGSFGVMLTRLTPPTLAAAHDAAVKALESSARRKVTFSHWLSALSSLIVADYLHQNDLSVVPASSFDKLRTRQSRFTEAQTHDICVEDELLVRVRASGVKEASRINLKDILQYHKLIGPEVKAGGEWLEQPADYYVQVIFLAPMDELREVWEREAGILSACIAGGLALPQIQERGGIERWGSKSFLAVPLAQTCDAVSLPDYLRLLAHELRALHESP